LSLLVQLRIFVFQQLIFQPLGLLLDLFVSAGIWMQPIYPEWLVSHFPKLLRDILGRWIALSGDPLMRSLMPTWKGRFNEFTWFWANTIWLGGAVQMPAALLGCLGLWQNVHATRILILFYGGTTAAGIVPCIATVWGAPPPGMILSDQTMVTLTDAQKNLIIGFYLPFLVIPLCMAGDAAFRLWQITNTWERATPCGPADDSPRQPHDIKPSKNSRGPRWWVA